MHIRIRTHSKVNAWLQVMPKTAATGPLHEIISLFLPLEVGDLLLITACSSSQDSFRLTSNRPDLVPGNSLESAWQAFSTASGASRRRAHFTLTVQLEKHLPEKTGLGAGSGDAGAFLVFLNQLYGLPFSASQLRMVAYSVGSDVPFFIEARPSIVRSTGNQIFPLDPLPPLACCIVVPTFRISTKDAFAHLDALMVAQGPSSTAPFMNLKTAVGILETGVSPQRQLSSEQLNSFEAVLTEQEKAVVYSLKKELLAQGALLAGLSGSGSAVYGVYTTRAAAEAAALDMARNFPSLQILTTDVL